MNHVDEMLSSFRAAPLPPALEAIDEPVFAGMALARERRAGRRSLALACGVAAVVGLWGGLAMPARDSGPARDRSLLAIPAAAPSHLLQA